MVIQVGCELITTMLKMFYREPYIYDRRDLGSSPRQVISVPPYKLTCTSVYPTYKDKTAPSIDSGSEKFIGGLAE
jgi:hypothetical protein